MTEEATETTTESTASAEDQVASMVTETTETTGRPENVPEKFWDAESSTVRHDDVLKSYNELQGKFGSFTGAPEEYGFNVSKDMTAKFEEMGLEISTEDDPLYEAALQMAKDTGMNQEGFDQLSNLYLMSQLGEIEASKELVANEMKELGDRAEQRTANISAWGEKNLSPELYEALQKTCTSAASVQVMEHLISQTRNAPVSDSSTAPAPGINEADLKAMQFANDEQGNRKIQVDPEYKAEFQRKMREYYGEGENRIMVG